LYAGWEWIPRAASQAKITSVLWLGEKSLIEDTREECQGRQTRSRQAASRKAEASGGQAGRKQLASKQQASRMQADSKQEDGAHLFRLDFYPMSGVGECLAGDRGDHEPRDPRWKCSVDRVVDARVPSDSRVWHYTPIANLCEMMR
jgi:hypothetical protein